MMSCGLCSINNMGSTLGNGIMGNYGAFGNNIMGKKKK